ncbi:hypothetical protein IMCC14465_13020 [alpha proteobacterium IMCC14465]|uniref:Flagellin n=1 Tax=alpha proteobacterium IMCC14465 TaxID=1220535 RepID=J9DI01_9PROT|nr:hypothetical protein IMCC14465_13020 [alpha proteobacterium IMCC14465]
MSNINTNMSAIKTLYHLERNLSGMDKAMERISSGMRITNAGDDAAGAAIVNRMTSQIKGLENAIRNSADAISLAQTAEGALNEVSAILQRIRELSVQAANGIYNGADRDSLNSEVVQLQNELQRIAETTYFNDSLLLNGTFQDTNFQIGYTDAQTHTVTIEDVRPSALGEYTLSTSQAGQAYALDQNGNFIPADANSPIDPTNGLRVDGTATAVAQISVLNVNYAGLNPSLDALSIAVDGHSVTVDLSAVTDQNSLVNALTTALSGDSTLSSRYTFSGDQTNGQVTVTAQQAGNPFTIDVAHTNNAIQQSDLIAGTSSTSADQPRKISLDISNFSSIDMANDTLSLDVGTLNIPVTLSSAINTSNDLADAIADAVQTQFAAGNTLVNAVTEDGSVILTGTGVSSYFTATVNFTDASGDSLSPITASESQNYQAQRGEAVQTLDITDFANFDHTSDTLTFTYRGNDYQTLTGSTLMPVVNESNIAELAKAAVTTGDAAHATQNVALNIGGAAITNITQMASSVGDSFTITVDGTAYTTAALGTADAAGLLTSVQNAVNGSGGLLSDIFTITQDTLGTLSFQHIDNDNHAIAISGAITDGAMTGDITNVMTLEIDGAPLDGDFFSVGDRVVIDIGGTTYLSAAIADNGTAGIDQSDILTALQAATLSTNAATNMSTVMTVTAGSTENVFNFIPAAGVADAQVVIKRSLAMDLSYHGVSLSGTSSRLDFSNATASDAVSLAVNDNATTAMDITVNLRVNGVNATVTGSDFDDIAHGDTFTVLVDGVDFNVTADGNGDANVTQAELVTSLQNATNAAGTALSTLFTIAAGGSDHIFTFQSSDGLDHEIAIVGEAASSSGLISTTTSSASGDGMNFATSGDMTPETARVMKITPSITNFSAGVDTLSIVIDQNELTFSATDLQNVSNEHELARIITDRINADSSLSNRVNASLRVVSDALEIHITGIAATDKPANFDFSLSKATGSTWSLSSSEETAFATGVTAVQPAQKLFTFNEAGIDPENDTFTVTINDQSLTIDPQNISSGLVFNPGNPMSSQDIAELVMLEINNNASLSSIVRARVPGPGDYQSEGATAYLNHLDEVILESLDADTALTTSLALVDGALPITETVQQANTYATLGSSGLYVDSSGNVLDSNRHQRFVNANNEVTEYRVADSGDLINEDGHVVSVDSNGQPDSNGFLAAANGTLLKPGTFEIVDASGVLQGGTGTPQTATITARTAASGALLLGSASAATPNAGTSAANAVSRIVDAEDITIYGHVGEQTIDIQNGMTAKEIADAVSAKSTVTGVTAQAETRLRVSFDKLAGNAFTDTMSFVLYGMDGTAADVTATINFGGQGSGSGEIKADLSNLRNAINAKSGTTGITATLSDDKQSINMLSVDGYDIVIENYDAVSIRSGMSAPAMRLVGLDKNMETSGQPIVLADSSTPNAVDSARVTGQVSFHSSEVFSVHTAADGAAGGGLFQAAPGAANLRSVADLDILTVANARTMLGVIDGALRRIDAERGDLGATINRMQYTINNLSNVVMNTKESRSRIQDSDIAVETANLTKAQILQQAAQAMLAQANQTAQSVLSLLQ